LLQGDTSSNLAPVTTFYSSSDACVHQSTRGASPVPQRYGKTAVRTQPMYAPYFSNDVEMQLLQLCTAAVLQQQCYCQAMLFFSVTARNDSTFRLFFTFKKKVQKFSSKPSACRHANVMCYIQKFLVYTRHLNWLERL
jgi:hypothetical protein